jgi:hypothetical protein
MFFRPFFIITVSCLLLTACGGGVSTVELPPEVIGEKSEEKLLPSKSKQTLDVSTHFQDINSTPYKFINSHGLCDLNRALKEISAPLLSELNYYNKTKNLHRGGLVIKLRKKIEGNYYKIVTQFSEAKWVRRTQANPIGAALGTVVTFGVAPLVMDKKELKKSFFGEDDTLWTNQKKITDGATT